MRKDKMIGLFLMPFLASGLVGCQQNDDFSVDVTTYDSTGKVIASTDSTEADETLDIDYYGFAEPVQIKYGFSFASDFSFSGDETYEENSWTELYKEHNIIPEFLYSVDSSQAETKLSTAIMSGEYPDILSPDSTEFLNYVNSDVVADITDAFETYATDELKEYLNVDGGLALSSCYVDGKLYGIPKMGNSYDSVTVMFIREDWLTNLGLEVPTTMDELKEVAYAFTYSDPDQNGVDDTYGIGFDGINVLNGSIGDVNGIFQGFGVYYGGNGMAFILDGDGELTWGGTNTDGAKKALGFLQDLYTEGCIAKDFITMDSNTIFEEAGAGNCGIWFGPMWAGMVPASSAIVSDPDAHVISAAIPDGLEQGNSKAYLNSTVEKVFCVSSKCENPEVLIKLLNLSVHMLCYPDSTEQFYTYYGDQDNYSGWKLSFTPTLKPLKNYDNYQKITEALETGDTSNLNAEQLGDYNAQYYYLSKLEDGNFDAENDGDFINGCALYTVFGDPQGAYAAIDKMIQEDSFVYSAYNSIATSTMSDNSETLKKMLIEKIDKIITGDDVESYDSFVESWLAIGGQDCIDDAKEWYESNK